MAILVDTGVIVALADRRDRHHATIRRFLETEARFETLIVPITVLPEVDYLVTQRAGAHAAHSVLAGIVSGEIWVEQLAPADVARALELMRQYADNSIGFVDASIVALAERLRITKLLTLDRRHFGPLRPRHCQAFEILP